MACHIDYANIQYARKEVDESDGRGETHIDGCLVYQTKHVPKLFIIICVRVTSERGRIFRPDA